MVGLAPGSLARLNYVTIADEFLQRMESIKKDVTSDLQTNIAL